MSRERATKTANLHTLAVQPEAVQAHELSPRRSCRLRMPRRREGAPHDKEWKALRAGAKPTGMSATSFSDFVDTSSAKPGGAIPGGLGSALLNFRSWQREQGMPHGPKDSDGL